MLFPEFGRFGFDPLAEMRRMQNEMNRLLSGFTAAMEQDFPPINLWLGENSVVVTAELPGLSEDDINISLQEDVLTLQGRRQPQIQEDVTWHRRERPYGSFARTLQLPFRADPDRAKARFNNGVLEIELERPEEDRPKKIAVRAA